MSRRFSENTEKKSVETLCRLSPSRCAQAKCVKGKSGRTVVVISTGNELVYLLEEHKIEHIINVSSPVVKFLDYADKKENIWIITKDDKLWSFSVPPDNEVKDKSDIANTSAELNIKTTDIDIDIFAELLGSDDESSLKNIQVSTPAHAISHSPIMQCVEKNIIHWEPGLLDVAIGPNLLITCCCKNDGLTVTAYPWTNVQDEKSSSPGNHENKLQILSHILYRIRLTGDIMCDSLGNHKDVSVLLCIQPDNGTLVDCACSLLDQQLFYALFRTHLGSNLPIVLLARNSGLVGFTPIGIQDQDSDVPLQILYHLEQPVAAMFGVHLQHKDVKAHQSWNSKKILNALVLVGALGRLIVITLQDPGKFGLTGVQFQEYHIPGPIVCSAVSHLSSILFYSTLKEVYAVCLTSGEKLDERGSVHNQSSLCTSSCILPSSLSPKSIAIPKVSALAVDESLTESETPVKLLCVKSDGRVLVVNKPLPNQEGIAGGCSSRSAIQVTSGERIKQCLADIKTKSDRVSHLRHEIQELDNVIKQLNTITHVLYEILRSREQQYDDKKFLESSCKNPGIAFSVRVDYEAQGGFSKPKVVLQCNLENSSKSTFSHGWSMVVQVCTSEPWFNDNGMVSEIESHSIMLDSSQLHHISIPLKPSLSFLSPTEVSCYICLDIKEILPPQCQEEIGCQLDGFAVQISNIKLDILNFLRSPKSRISFSAADRDNTSTINILQKTLENLNGPSQNDLSSSELISKKPVYFMQTICLSKQAVDFIKKRIVKCLLGEHLTQSCSDQLSVLHFLLWGSRKHLELENVSACGDSIVARTPNEDEVKFQVIHQAGTSALSEGLEVHVHVSSEALRCSVHSALITVLQPVLQRTCESISSLPIAEIQKPLNKLKQIQVSLDMLGASPQSMDAAGKLSQDTRYKNACKKLVKIYRELREVPTMIT